MVGVMVVFLPMTTVLVTICMVWYTGDWRRGVTPSLAITVLGRVKLLVVSTLFSLQHPSARTPLPVVANGDLLVNSLQLHKLVDIVNEGEDDGEDNEASALADAALQQNISTFCNCEQFVATLGWWKGWQMLKYLSVATMMTL